MGIWSKVKKLRDGIRKGVAVADDLKPVIGMVAPKVVTDAIGAADEMVNAEAVIEGQVTSTVKKVKGKK